MHNALPSLRSLPITASQSYHNGAENAGLFPHRYAIVTIQLPHAGSSYMKI